VTSRILIALAGLMGAGGVILAAVAAHIAPGSGLDSAAYMLSFHAVAVLAAVALLQQGRLWRPLAIIALAGFVLGGVLFSGDIALHALAGHRMFPMAAPTGGTIMIVAWLVLAVAAITGPRRSER
jgi:uncharacterized membrane protein YgdD (TMEM256/DUF423 family)